jgi:hypothetical protein
MWLYGMGVGLFAALASIAYQLITAMQEADLLVHGPRPMSAPGVVDFRPIRQHAYFFFVGAIPPAVGITLACVFVGALLAARASRRFAVGMGTALLGCLVSSVLYAGVSALIAQYLLGPAIDDAFLTAWSLAVSMVMGLGLLILGSIVGASASSLGAFV